MGACFRLRGCRRAKPPAVLAGDGDFAPAIFCAAKESHRKTQARWMVHRKGYGKASLRKSGAQKRLSATTLFTGTSCTKGFDKRACYARTASA